MEIDFNTNDFNIVKIRRRSKLNDFEAEGNYRVFGLMDAGNPTITIQVPYKQVNRAKTLKKFFEKNNVCCHISAGETTRIGLRKDLRRDVNLAAAILQTIIYFLERRLTLPKKTELPGIPQNLRKAN